MPIPPFQDVMLPLLHLAEDGKDHRLVECYEVLAKEFALTPDELAEVLPSGKKLRFYDRVQWASTYLRQTRLLESPKRGVFRITDRGKSVLAENPERVDLAFLARYPELDEFRKRRGDKKSPSESTARRAVDETPEESLERVYDELHDALAGELLERIKAAPPQFFERLVVELLVKMGYGGTLKDAGSAIGRSGDGGVDGIIKEDRLGLDAVYIQAKRWDSSVGRPVVQGFAGSLEGHRARKGVLITTSSFTRDAQDYVDRIEKRIVLIDGPTLADLLIEHGVGVTTAATFDLKKIDADYFDEI